MLHLGRDPRRASEEISMKIVATSDLHGEFPEIPECDLLLIGGDVCPVKGDHNHHVQRNWLRDIFGPWMESLPAKDIVWIAGNHDFAAEQPGFIRNVANELPGIYLQDTITQVNGLWIYGTPYVPNLPGWAFHGDNDYFRRSADQLPECDIVLAHGPPLGILDEVPGRMFGGDIHVGAPHMSEAYERIGPKHVVFGHIHEGYGRLEKDGTVYRNVAHMDGAYNPVNKPHVWEMD